MTSRCGTLYHNPRCSKSREALALLQARGVAPDIVLYLESPPSIASLRELLRMLGSGPRGILRTGEAEFDAMGLGDPGVDDATLLAAMHAHPRLIERPIYVRDNHAVIGRPPERVLELLD